MLPSFGNVAFQMCCSKYYTIISGKKVRRKIEANNKNVFILPSKKAKKSETYKEKEISTLFIIKMQNVNGINKKGYYGMETFFFLEISTR